MRFPRHQAVSAPGFKNQPDKPVGSFLFSGPTASAKTRDPPSCEKKPGVVGLLPLTCPVYERQHGIAFLSARLLAYVGFDQAGLADRSSYQEPLTCVAAGTRSRRRTLRYSMLLLQVMDHGTLTDQQTGASGLPQCDYSC